MAQAQELEKKDNVVDLAEARLAREREIEGMVERGEVIDIDGEQVPLENLDTVQAYLDKKVEEYSARQKTTAEVLAGVDGGDLDEVRERLAKEQETLNEMTEEAFG